MPLAIALNRHSTEPPFDLLASSDLLCFTVRGSLRKRSRADPLVFAVPSADNAQHLSAPIFLYRRCPSQSRLYSLHLFAAEEPERPHEQHRNECNVRCKRSTSATQVRVQVSPGQTLQHSNRDGRDDRPWNTVEAADDHNRKDFKANQRQPETTSGDRGPERGSKHADDPGQAPNNQ